MNKVALVTGGTGGIGTAICQKLASMGCKVAAGFNNAGVDERAKEWQQQQKEKGFDFLISYGDISNFESAGVLLNEVQSALGPIDIVVNNAGITRDGMLRKMDPLMWDAVMRTNLDSVFNVTRQVIEGMIERQFGRIINISSVNGQKGQFGQANYSAAKAGMHGFTKALAQETASKGITVNTISPGYVRTPMTEKMRPEVLQSIVDQVPMKRLAEPTEIAALIGYLVSPEAAYITGANISINGGLHMF